MKTRSFIICIALLSASVSFGQQKRTFADSLTKTLNLIVASVPDSCRKFYGTQHGAVKTSYNSTISLPGSTDNRFDIGFMDYPIIFISYLPAGNDRTKVVSRINEIDRILKSSSINFKGKRYSLAFNEGLSQKGDKPDYKYTIVHAPQELAFVKLFVRLNKNSTDTDCDYQITMGVYTRTKQD